MKFNAAISGFLAYWAISSTAVAQELTPQELEQIQQLQQMQQQSLDSVSKSLPSMSGFMNSMTGAIKKLDEIDASRNQRALTQTKQLELTIEEVLDLFDAGKKSRAKIRALSIKWTPIGSNKIDDERTQHFENVRGELLSIIDGE